jgi:hypothetical protein
MAQKKPLIKMNLNFLKTKHMKDIKPSTAIIAIIVCLFIAGYIQNL